MATGQVTASNVRGSGRDVPLRFGWRMPMWDPAGAPATSWLPAVRANLSQLRGKYDSVWLSDHFVPGTPWMPPEPDTLECWTATVHFSAIFPDYQYGQIVMGNNYRHPPLLAKAASTMQVLTGGKLILGIGAGWMESEYRMYGYPYPPPKQRIEEPDDAVQLIRALWSDSPASFQGKHFAIDAAHANPRPAEPPIVMIGASGEQLALRVVAKHADWWNATTPTPADLAAKRAVLAEHCAKVGRDVDDILVNWQCQCVAIADTEAEAQRLADASPLHQHGGRGSVIGTPGQVREKLQAMVDVGVRDFILRFAREIAPGIRAGH